jgi:SAM-dependent methyltransferase
VDYDTFASAYAEHRRADPAVLRSLVAGARITASSRVLEVGSGTGNYSIAVEATTGAACVGVEPSDGMREVAASRASRVEFVTGAAERLPFGAGVFDVVFYVQVLHHLSDVRAAFAEAGRVLAPGGVLCALTDDEESIRGRVHRRYFPETLAIELARYPALEELGTALEAAGLVPGSIERVETPITVTDARPFRALAFSSLALLEPAALEAGLERLEADLARGPIVGVDAHVLVWAAKA